MTIDYWRGLDGAAYTARNFHVRADNARAPFWSQFLNDYPVSSVLEVGCNVGGNLKPLAGQGRRVVGVDVNDIALAWASQIHGVETYNATADHLPFYEGEFELVLTCGLLIHVHPADLGRVMDEVWRVSRRYLWIAEYEAPEEDEVQYRGRSGLLWRRPYAGLFGKRFDLKMLASWDLGKDQGFDRVTATLWEKP